MNFGSLILRPPYTLIQLLSVVPAQVVEQVPAHVTISFQMNPHYILESLEELYIAKAMLS